MFKEEQITGTLVNYFVTCKREAWLYAHKIHANQDDENVLMGKAISQIKEAKMQDFPFSNLHFDKLSRERGHYMITEYKKSLKNPNAAKMQLLFYMFILKEALKLKAVQGKVVCGKRSFLVEGSDENFTTIKTTIQEIINVVNEPKSPLFIYKKICDKCAYRDYCL